MRASATSRIVSAAVLPSTPSKADAGKADDASPFALLLNDVAAPAAVPPKNAQNNGGKSNSSQNNNSQDSNANVSTSAPARASQGNATGAAAQAVSQTALKPVKPSKDDKSDDDDATDAGSVASDATLQQLTAQIQASQQLPPPPVSVPPPAPAANTSVPLTENDAGQDSSVAPAAGPAGAGASVQTAVAPQTLTPETSAQDVAQANAAAPPPTPQPVPPTLVQNSVQPKQPAPQPNNSQPQASADPNTVQPSVAQSPPIAPAAPQVQSPVANNTVQAGSAQTVAPPPAGANGQTPAAANSVPLTEALAATIEPVTSQAQPAAAGAQPATPQVQPAANPGKAADDKSTKGKGAADATPPQAQTGAPAQPPIQPDASQIVTATTPATLTTAGDDDAGDDEPGIDAAGAASVAASGPAKAQGTQNGQASRNLQAALADRQAPQPQPPAQNTPSQTAGGTDGAKAQNTDGNQSPVQADLKPWQAKPQTGDANPPANADAVKQAAAPAPQAPATDTTPVSKPADAAANTLTLFAGPQAQQSQPASAPVAAHTVQVSTPSPSVPALAVEIAARSQSGAKQFDIRLDPPELGHVEVRLSIDATGKASAHLSADQPQTLDLLQKDAPALTRALRDAGLNVSQNGLNFSLRQQQGNANGGTGQNPGGNGRSFTLTANGSLDTTSGAAVWRAPANGRLDIRV